MVHKDFIGSRQISLMRYIPVFRRNKNREDEKQKDGNPQKDPQRNEDARSTGEGHGVIGGTKQPQSKKDGGWDMKPLEKWACEPPALMDVAKKVKEHLKNKTLNET